MEPKDNRDSNNKKIYETHTFNTNALELKRVSFELFHMSLAKFSGPIAAYINKSIQTDNSYSSEETDYILMFSNKGSVFNKVPFFIKERIIFFEFLYDEVLMVGTQASYYIIDPFRSSIKMMDLSQSFKNDKILGYKVVGTQLYVVVGKRIFEIRNIYQPIPKEIAFLNINLENPIMIFEQNPGSENPHIIYLHERSEIYSSISGNQILQCKQLGDSKTKLMFLNRWIDESKNTYYVLVFHNPLKIGFFANGSSTFFEPPSLKTVEEQPPAKSRHNYGISNNKGYYCAWIGDTAFLSNKLWVIRLNSRGMNILKNQQTIIGQEIDGVRLVGYSSQIIRVATPQYLSLFKGSRNASILQLYSAFEEYQNSTVVNVQLLESNTNSKEQNLETIIKATQFALDSIQQMRILKFGIFLKTYYCMSANLSQLCQQLRLINNLRYQAVNRCLTLQQLRYLKEHKLPQFVSILLRYNLHFIADLVGGGQKVYFHWAKCKIQKESEDVALDSIIKKFEHYKEKKSKELSYVDIARYAIETKRFQLAQNLIQHQTNLKRKVIILLWMASLRKEVSFLEKALENAEKSMDSDTINRVIFEIQREDKGYATSESINKLLDKKIILKNHYIEYLRQKNLNKLKDYYLKKKQNNQLGLLALRSYEGEKYKSTESFELVKKLLPVVAESQATPKSSEYPLFLRRALNPSYEINQAEIDRFKKQKNPEFLAQVLIQRGMLDEAVGVIYMMPSQQAFSLLFKIQKWKEAITLARQTKNLPMLNKILELAPNSFRQQISAAFTQLTNK